ncbi:MAG: hypothetical protein E6124_00890 [Blautia producta]|nr:hypothetical protein [Blautia producta]MDU5380742.1 hypothetical protein [Blautia producta]MDU6882066.1 hypothetical protein [Blautia producta]
MKNKLVRTQFVIMKILETSKATNYMRATTLSEIAEKEGRNKINTLYKHMRGLENNGLVKKGAKFERANAYYLSEEGLKLLKKYENTEERTDEE